MFRGLASYFLGDNHPLPEACTDYKTTDDEDWVLVDVTNNALNTCEESAVQDNEGEKKPSAKSLPPLNICHEDSSTPELTPPSSPSQMEGSWYVTPPACFTAGGPIQLATSPLENLLIEHPSMSVYASTGLSSLSLTMPQSITQSVPSASTLIVDTGLTSHHQTTSNSAAEQDTNDDPPVENEEPVRTRGTSRSRRRRSLGRDQSTEIRRRTPRRNVSLAARAGLVETQHQHSNTLQKVQHQKGQQTLKRSYLDRQNRVYGFQGSARHMRRKDRMIRPSGANNNRKCC